MPNDPAHEELLRLDTAYWVVTERVVNEKKKPITFKDHYFLKALYLDQSQEIAVIKAAQAGVSTWAICTTLHDGRYQGINQIHVFPSTNDGKTFVQSKVNPMIKENPSIGEVTSKEDADSVQQKQFGKGFLFYKGTRGETAGTMITSDRNIYDEYDRCDMENIKNYESRLEGIGSLKQQRWISTPTVPGYGIDAKWEQSDQKHWRFDCPHCGDRQHMEWPNSVDMEGRCYICIYCGGELTHDDMRRGAWEAKYPGRKISGYWINQMMIPWVSPGDLIDGFKAAEKEGDLANFFNFRLGMPFQYAESRMSAGLVLRNIKAAEVIELNSCMGVDVQLRELYVIIGNEQAIYGITKIPDHPDDETGMSKWVRLAQLMEIYDVRVAVIDAGFKPDTVIDFVKKFPGKVYAQWYSPAPKGGKIMRFADEGKFTEKRPEELEEQMKVLTDRERIIDKTLAYLVGGTITFNFAPKDPNLQELIRHMETMYARTIEKKDGQQVREWASTGKNDYVHALVNWTVAMHKKGIYKE